MASISHRIFTAVKFVFGGPESCQPTYYNHMIFLTELHSWAVYYALAFSYTNRLGKRVRLSNGVRKDHGG
jgi:hypothetical protein